MAKRQPEDQVRAIVSSHVPLGEEEEAFNTIRLKMERKQHLTKQDEKLLERLAGKAKQWEEEVKSSAETDLDYTLGG